MAPDTSTDLTLPRRGGPRARIAPGAPPAPGAAAAPGEPSATGRVEPNWAGLAPSGVYARVGRPLLETALALCVLPAAVAVGLVIALVNTCVFRDPRRVFFLQPRRGFRGQVFTLYKFRTMREARTDAFGSWSGGECALRVTRFGRLLRNTHLDELPQILNVVRGEMSFIGPRPEMLEIDAWANEHIEGFERRLAVKPGITGLAQITQGYTGHDVRAYAEKLAHDERYREGFSLRQDLAVLVRTALWMMRGRGWRWNASAAVADRPDVGEPPAQACTQSREAATETSSSSSGE